MESLKDIVAKRSAPGVLILDLAGQLLYSNQEAQDLLVLVKDRCGERCIPTEVLDLCEELRGTSPVSGTAFGVVRHPEGEGDDSQALCSLRAFFLGDHHEGGSPSHVMVLMEKIIRNRVVDVEGARRKFQLSKREAEVVKLISQGLANKEISSTIFISEFTVKDHIKNVMRKMGASTRNEIIALLL